MSSSSIRSRISGVQREIQSLQRRLTDLSSKQASAMSRIGSTKSSMSRATSASTIQSKGREIERLEREVAKLEDDKARVSRDIGRKTEELHRLQNELYKEQEREQTKSLRRLEQQVKDAQFAQTRTAVRSVAEIHAREEHVEYDAFISHASEDKDAVARPLAQALEARGHKVWYDEFALRVGDSLRRSIDRGLSQSRFGIVVLSPSFFEKNWPQYELDGLVAKEMQGGKVLLPLWHKVSKNEVIAYSPSLADRVALNTASLTIEEIADKLSEAIQHAGPRPDAAASKPAEE